MREMQAYYLSAFRSLLRAATVTQTGFMEMSTLWPFWSHRDCVNLASECYIVTEKKLSLSLHLTFCTHLYSRFFCYEFIARSYMKIDKRLYTLNLITSKSKVRKNTLPRINVLLMVLKVGIK